MFFIIASLFDKGKLSVWVTIFKSGVFVVEVLDRLGKSMEGIGLLVCCKRA